MPKGKSSSSSEIYSFLRSRQGVSYHISEIARHLNLSAMVVSNALSYMTLNCPGMGVSRPKKGYYLYNGEKVQIETEVTPWMVDFSEPEVTKTSFKPIGSTVEMCEGEMVLLRDAHGNLRLAKLEQ